MIFLPSAKFLYRPQLSVAPWTPLSLTTALYGWYKADAGLSVSTDGASVATWADQSTNNNNLAQASTANQGVFRTASNGVNGLPVLEFPASSTVPTFFTETAFPGGTATGYSFYIVSRNPVYNSAAQYTGAFSIGNFAQGSVNHFCNHPTEPTRQMTRISGSTGNDFGESVRKTDYVVTKSSRGQTLNSTKQQTTYSPLQTQTAVTNNALQPGFNIGRNYVGSVGASIAEVVVCNRELLGSEEISLDAYFRTRYGFGLYYGADLPVTSPALWLDASRSDSLFVENTFTTAVTTDNGPVGGWKDLSGNNRNALQSGTNRPTWRTPINGQNGLGVISFNGSTQSFAVSNTIGWGLVYSGDFTISMVHKVSSVTGGVLFGQDNGSGTVPKWMFGYGSNGVAGAGQLGLFYYNGASIYVRVAWSPTAGQTYLITATRSGNDHYFYVDGAQVGSTQTTASRPTNPTVLATIGQAETTFWLGGSIAETVIYLSNLNATQLASVKSYLSGKWGTP